MSTDFNQTAQTLIKDALLLCGGLEDDENPDSDQEQHAMRALNRMVKSWSKRGLKAWCFREEELQLVEGVRSYTIGPTGDLVTERPLTIDNVRRVWSTPSLIDNSEIPVRMFSRQEYMQQSHKDNVGDAVAVYYDPQLVNGVLYVWGTSYENQKLRFTSKQYIEDFDSQNDIPYFPVEWLDAIVYNLASRLCPKYEVSPENRMILMQQAQQFLMESEGADSEYTSVYLGVSNQW